MNLTFLVNFTDYNAATVYRMRVPYASDLDAGIAFRAEETR